MDLTPSVVIEPGLQKRFPFYKMVLYGIGHYHNDMCASMWFTYLLIFVTRVLGLSSTSAGNLILIGQVADALFTPLVGYESDRSNIHRLCFKYGRRKSWHFVGFICVTFSFAFLFVECFGCVYRVTSEFVEMFYYVPFVVVFQFGWACVQISHLALLPELTSHKGERSTLNAVRYLFTVVANVTVFLLVFVFVGLVGTTGNNVTREDGPRFSLVSFLVTALGVLSTAVFHVGTQEPKRSPRVAASTNSDGVVEAPISPVSKRNSMRWKDWFRFTDFYLVALLYMCVRIFGNLTQAYLPLYVLETQHFGKEFIAIVPATVYCSSFVTSFTLSFVIGNFIPRKPMMLFGLIAGTASCIWMWFHELHIMIFAVSVLLGLSSTTLLVGALAMIADLINDNTESGAFVYGSMSFMDKISTGVAIQIVQSLQPSCVTQPCPKLDFYYRGVVVYVPGAALFVAFTVLLFIWPRNIGVRMLEAQADNDSTTDPAEITRVSDEDSLLG